MKIKEMTLEELKQLEEVDKIFLIKTPSWKKGQYKGNYPNVKDMFDNDSVFHLAFETKDEKVYYITYKYKEQLPLLKVIAENEILPFRMCGNDHEDYLQIHHESMKRSERFYEEVGAEDVRLIDELKKTYGDDAFYVVLREERGEIAYYKKTGKTYFYFKVEKEYAKTLDSEKAGIIRSKKPVDGIFNTTKKNVFVYIHSQGRLYKFDRDELVSLVIKQHDYHKNGLYWLWRCEFSKLMDIVEGK